MQFFGPIRVGAIAYASGATVALDLPRNRFISSVILRTTAIGDTAGSVTETENGLAALVPTVRLIANGKDERVSAELQDLYRYTKMRSQNTALLNSLLTTVSQTDVALGEVDAKIDFAPGQDPRTNKLDVRALLPAHMFASLRLEVTWGTNASLGTGYTVDSGAMEVAIKEVSLSDAEIKAVSPFMAYYLTELQQTKTAAVGNYGFEVNLPVGKIIRRFILTNIDNALRVAGVLATPSGLSAYRVRDTKRGNLDVIETSWEMSVAQDRQEYGITPDTGVTIVDLDSVGSLDARGYSQGQARLQANVDAPTGVSNVRLLLEELATS